MNCIAWALLGMVGYSFVPLFVRLATIRPAGLSPFALLSLATAFVAAVTFAVATVHGDLQAITWRTTVSPIGIWTLGTAVSLSVAVTSLFKALSLGPASVVVPIYGMFIVGGATLGMLLLGEPVSPRKLLGIGLAVLAIVLIAKK